MDLLLTGANGFLGSQIATQWLHRHPGARIACLVRGADPEAAGARLHAALAQAVTDQDMQADLAELASRVTVIQGDLTETSWIRQAGAWLRGPAEIFHCAANLSFREVDRAAVWRTNVDGTAALLAALPSLPEVAAFNYVSTAYVAGDRAGDILETETDRPAHFHNPYEESKWTAEQQVRAVCGARGTPYRIFRPSIIIAHSVTHRMASASGFYKVAETLAQLGQSKRTADRAIRLTVPAGATLDLIPVDMVVDEILGLMALGARSVDQTFHVTSASPLGLGDVLTRLAPMSGIAIGTGPEAAQPSPLGDRVMRGLHYYLPYLSQVRRFGRHNVEALSVSDGQTALGLDVEALRGFVQSYLADPQRTA